MFDNVDQLEQEIIEFQKNILASSELIKSIENLIAVTKEQQKLFALKSSDMESKIGLFTKSLQSSYDEALVKLESENSILLKKFIAKEEELVQSLSINNQKFLSEVAQTITSTQQEYTQRIETAESSVRHCEQELNRKYESFLSKLESTNIDQMHKTCQNIERSLKMKFLVVSTGVILSLILIIVSFFS